MTSATHQVWNVQRAFIPGEHTVLSITWDDSFGSHDLQLTDAAAISAAKVLWSKRSDADRLAYLEQIISEERRAA